MRKKIMVVGSLVLFILLLISFSGCIDQTEELNPTIQRIKDAGKLLVGTSTPYEPMEYIDINGDIVGFDIDIAEAIATALGVELEIKDMEFDDILVAVENGSVDISIAAITITVERSKKVLFSNAYINAGQVIIVNETNEDIGGPNDLDNKTVGVQSGTTSEDEALKYTNSTLVKKYDDYGEALEHLLAGDLDAIVIDYSAGVGLIKDTSGLEIVGDPFTDELYGVAMKKGETALKTEIDKVIADIDIDSLKNKWF
jgi:polar amino acid transport system substrate-binding protein